MKITLTAKQAKDLLKRELREARRNYSDRVPFLLSVQSAWKRAENVEAMLNALDAIHAQYDTAGEVKHHYISGYLKRMITLEGLSKAINSGRPLIVSEIASGLGSQYYRIFGFRTADTSVRTPHDITEEVALLLNERVVKTITTKPVKASHAVIAWNDRRMGVHEVLSTLVEQEISAITLW